MEIELKDTLEVLDLVDAGVDAVTGALADDGKITLSDLPHGIAVFTKIGPAVEGIKNVGEELANLNEEEFSILKDRATSALGRAVSDEEVVGYVEDGFLIVRGVYGILKRRGVFDEEPAAEEG